MTTKQQISNLCEYLQFRSSMNVNCLENREGKVSESLRNFLQDVKNLNVYASQIADTVMASINNGEKVAKMSSKQAYAIAAAAVEGGLVKSEQKKQKVAKTDSSDKSALKGQMTSFDIFRKRFADIEEAKVAFMATVNKSKRYTDDFKKAVEEMISKIA